MTTEDELEELCEECTTMTDWEMEFVDSCSKQVDHGWHLSLKQKNIIHKIYTERM